MKKTAIFFSFVLLFFMCFVTKTSASNFTASYKGFEIINLEYVKDYTENTKTLKGDTWEYGHTDMWSAVYKKQEGTSMFYFVLVETKVSSNLNSLKNGYYRMVNDHMDLTVEAKMDSSSDKLNLIKSAPLGDFFGENTSTETISVSLGLGMKKSQGTSVSEGGIVVTDGKEQSLSFGVQWTTSYSINNINYTPSSENGNKKFTSKVDFAKKTNKKLNNSYPYRGDFILRTTVVYELEDYTPSLEKALHFEINYAGAIRKHACNITNTTVGYETLTGSYNRSYNFS